MSFLKLTCPGRGFGTSLGGHRRHADVRLGLSSQSPLSKTLLMSDKLNAHTAEPHRPSLTTFYHYNYYAIKLIITVSK